MVIIAKYSNTVEYKLKTTLDSSGISKLQAEIKKTQTELKKLSEQNIISDSAMGTAQAQLSKFSKILNQSFNSKIGMLDLSKVNKLMGENALSIGKISTAFSMAGTKGEMAFNNILGRVGKIDTGLKSMTKTTDKIMNTFGNTVRWGVIASGFQSIMNSAHEAVQYVKDLDTSLTNIMMVTDYSKEQMNEYAKSANEAAKALGSTTVAMTDATLVFAQQGFDLNKSDQLAQLSTKLANASQQDTATTSDQITAYMNAYGLDSNIEKLSSALDSWAEVANVSAADVQELATASQKAASTANTVGVNMDQLAAQIATIESVTREAPENIGNGLKTIYARFSDIAMGDTLDDGVNLGTVTGTLEKVGVSVLGSDGKMRQVGAIMEDLMKVWSNIDSTQKNAIATTLAGKYQLARFEALMNRSDMYNEYKSASQNADGTLDVMNEKYVNSIEGRMNKLQATFEETIGKFFETDDFYGFIDGLTTVIDLFNDLTDAIGGGATALTGLGAILTKTFSGSIANSIGNFVSNRRRESLKKSNAQVGQDIFNEHQMGTIVSDRQRALAERVGSVRNAAGQDEASQIEANKIVEKAIELENLRVETEDKLRTNVLAVNEALKIQLETEEDLLSVKRNEEGTLVVDRSKLTKKINTDGKAYEKYDPSDLPDTTKDRFAKKSFLDKRLTGLSISEDTTNVRNQFDAVIDGYTNKFDGFKNSLKNTTKDLKENVEYVGMLGDEYGTVVKDTEKIVNLLNNKNSLGDISDEELEKIRQLLNELESINTKVNNNLENASKVKPSMKDVNEAESDLSGLSGAIGQNDNEGKDFALTQKSKEELQSITQAIAGVTSLSFAWQSFQSLGSLWADSDVDGGEKLLQTIMNLTMSLPMLIDGFKSLKEVGDLSTLKDSISEIFNNKINILNQNIAKTNKLTMATKAKMALLRGELVATTTAMGAFSKAMMFLSSGPGIALVLGIMAISTAVSAASKTIGEFYDKTKEKAENSITNYKEKSTDTDNFNKLYENYKKTGEGADQLKESASKLIDTFDLQNQKVNLATGNYEKLSESINNADKASRKLAERDVESFLNGANAASLNGNLLGIGNASIYTDLSKAVGPGATETLSKINEAQNEGSYDKAIGAAKQRIEKLNSAIDDIEKEITDKEKSGEDTSSLKETKKKYLKNIDDINAALNLDDIKDYIEKQQQLMQYKAQDIQDSLVGKSYQEIVDEYLDSSNGMSEYISSLGDWSDQLSWMISQTTDETAKLKLQLEKSYTDSGRTLYGKVTDTISEQGIDTKDFGIEDSGKYADEVVKGFQDQIKNSGLTEKEQLQFIASLDMDASLGEIQSQIDNINASDNLPKLAFEPTLTDRSDFSKEEISDLLKDTDMSESGFNRMSSAMFNSDEMQGTAQNIENQIKELRDSGDQSEETAQKIADLRKQYERLGDSAKDITAYNLQMNNGISKLTKRWKDLGKALEKDASKGTSDYYKALGELDEILSDILNIDVGALSDDFYKNEDAIDAMARAADGDADAIDDLRDIASEDIITHLKVENISDEDKDYLINEELLPMLSDFQAQVDKMPIGAEVDINTDPFILKLNELAALGQISAEQLTNILSSVGMDATITEVPSEPVWNETKMKWPKFQQNKETGIIEPTGEYTEFSTYTQSQSSFPQITGATYTGSGVQTAGSNSRGSSSSGGSGGSGGGGGGGGSSYEPKTKDRNDDELDRYKKVDAQLNKIDKTLDKLNTDKERLVGYKWQNAMAKEIKLLYKQIDLQKEKLELQKQEAEEKRNQLANDYGITFDADGIPQNYKEKFQELQNSLNDAIDAYNNSTTEEDQNYWEDIIEQRQKAFDDFKDLIDKYIDVQIDGIEESEKNIQDYYDKIEDMRIEAFNKQIESVKTIKDINDAWIEFQQIGKGRSDDVFRVGDTSVMKLANAWQLSNENMDEYYDNLIAREQKRWHETDDEQEKANAHARAERLRELKANALAGKYDGRNGSGLVDAYIERGSTLSDQIKQMEETGTSSIYGENSKQLYEDAEEFVKDYVSYVKDIEQAQEAVFQSIMDGIDQINDWMNERLDQYDNIIQRLDHQANLVEALRGEESYDELNNIYQAQNANYDAQMTEVKQNIATWENLKKTLEEGSDQWKEVNNKIVESQQKLDDLVESSIENLQKIYENTVKKSLKTWTSNLFNGESDIDWVADQWELINRNADYYLDSTNKAYNIQKLQTKYLDLLDNASGLDTQHKITEQMNQQLDLLRNKTKLSQYDVEYANAQLEILQKQIALEDAQRNKSQMKLRRDNQGNYSYVYTANEDNVRSAENDLLDSKNNAYNLSKDQIKQTQSDALSAYQEAFSQIETIKNSAIGKTEEGKQRIQKILDELKEYLNGVGEQLSTAQGNILYDFTSMVDSLSQENKAGVEDIADQIKNGNDEAFSAIDSRWNASFTKWLLDSTNFEKAQEKLLSDFNNATSNWQVNVNKIATKVGEDFNDVSKTVNKCTDATNELAKSTEAFYQKCDEGAKKIGGWQDELTNYQKMLAKLKDETGKAYQTIEKLTNQIKELETKNANQAAEIEYMKYGGSSSSGGSGEEGGSIDPSSYRAGDFIGYTGQYYNDSWGQSPVGNWYSGEQGAVRISSFSGEPYGDNSQTGEYSVHIETPDGGHLGWIRPDQMFDTGGYTGDWENGITEAKNGKLAFLHQKELVLNETDTANILNAVNMIRAMTDGLKSGALNSALSSINSFSGMNSQSSQDLEQNIHIDANFPNVKDASEIEQAILSLADQATQYIHKIR